MLDFAEQIELLCYNILMEQLENWLELLKTAWEKKNPDLAIELCAEKFIWYEAPFQNPITTRQGLLDEWESVQNHKDISMKYEILSLTGNVGIAKWSAVFKRLSEETSTELEGIYLVKLDSQGKCTEFHQWYNSKY